VKLVIANDVSKTDLHNLRERNNILQPQTIKLSIPIIFTFNAS
jgi:hypothetical protein